MCESSGTSTGNFISDDIRTFDWDAENRLAAVNESGTLRSEFSYDGLSRRVRIVEKSNGTVTSTKNLVWTGLEIAEERNVSNAVTKRYYPQGVQIGTANYFYTRDHLGSIRELTNNSGDVQIRYDYDLYGRRTKLSGSMDADFGFTGHYQHVASGLTLAPYREYDVGLGRWISRDPIGERGPDGSNLYNYVRNSPLNYIDSNGEWAHIAIAAGIGGLVNGGITAYQGGSFWKGFVAGAVGAGIAAATLNPAAGLAAVAGLGSIETAVASGAVSGALGSLANSATSAALGACPKNVLQSAALAVISGGLLGPIGAAANEFPIGTPAGNLSNVGAISMSITETAISTIPNN